MIIPIKSALRYLLKHNFQADYLNRQAFGYLKSCSQILDVGCGIGEFIKLAPSNIVGLDTNKQTLKLCRQKGFKVKFGSATNIPYRQNNFDGLHCSHVIEHLYPDQVYKFFQQATKVLKPNGILIISTPILWPGFYHNLTHIKPYSPQAITRYLVETAPDTTFPRLKSRYRLIALHWRYRYLTKTGYTIVLKKLA